MIMQRRFCSFVGALLFAGLSMGCLQSESIEARYVLDDEGKPVRVVYTEYNLSSSSESVEDAREDFENLISRIENPEWSPIEEDDKTVAVSREIFVADDELNLRTTRVFTDRGRENFHEHIELLDSGEKLIGYGDRSDVLATDGRIVETEQGAAIVWPKDARTMTLHFKKDERDEVFVRNSALMRQWFEEEMAG